MTALVSMRPAYYPVFFSRACEAYAAENVCAGRWPEAEAAALAAAESERLLPQGIATPEHQLLEIQAAPDGETVGFVWLAHMKRGASTVAFVYQIYVEPGARRQGHARAALQAVALHATRAGLSGVALHVFAHNAAARALYAAEGYTVASLNLHKALPPAGA
jgi:ribosomal protein S18 acetylase RimI-like enzyme